MMKPSERSIRLAAALWLGLVPVWAEGQAEVTLNRTPKPHDWASLAKLPDWSGNWTPFISDQDRRIKTDPVPWQPQVAEQIAAMEGEEKAGRPRGLFIDC